jgi:hypothetical protein
MSGCQLSKRGPTLTGIHEGFLDRRYFDWGKAFDHGSIHMNCFDVWIAFERNLSTVIELG